MSSSGKDGEGPPFDHYGMEGVINNALESYGKLHTSIKLLPVRGSEAHKDPAYATVAREQLVAARQAAEDSVKDLKKHKSEVDAGFKRSRANLSMLEQGGGRLTHWQTKTEFEQAILVQRQRYERVRELHSRFTGLIHDMEQLIKQANRVAPGLSKIAGSGGWPAVTESGNIPPYIPVVRGQER